MLQRWSRPPHENRQGSRQIHGGYLDLTIRLNNATGPANWPGVVRESPVLTAACNFIGSRMNGDHTAAREWTYVGLAFFIQRQIPADDAAHSIPQDATECLAPFGPVHQIFRIDDVRSS